MCTYIVPYISLNHILKSFKTRLPCNCITIIIKCFVHFDYDTDHSVIYSCVLSWWKSQPGPSVPVPLRLAPIDRWLLLTWHLPSRAFSYRKPMWHIKNRTPAFMFVNSIDLHNNLKKWVPRIRQGQTCFSVCYDACSICLIRERKAEAVISLKNRLWSAWQVGASLSTPFGLPPLMKAIFH